MVSVTEVCVPGIVRRVFAELSVTSPWESKQFLLWFFYSTGEVLLGEDWIKEEIALISMEMLLKVLQNLHVHDSRNATDTILLTLFPELGISVFRTINDIILFAPCFPQRNLKIIFLNFRESYFNFTRFPGPSCIIVFNTNAPPLCAWHYIAYLLSRKWSFVNGRVVAFNVTLDSRFFLCASIFKNALRVFLVGMPTGHRWTSLRTIWWKRNFPNSTNLPGYLQ